MRKAIVGSILAVLVLVFVIAGYHVGKILWDNYQNKQNDESQREQYVTVLPTKPAPTQPSTQNPGETPAPTEPEVETNAIVRDLMYHEETNKQFITVQTKNGNYFYIIIDRSGDTENVYFLNLVDEADLFALMETEEETAIRETKEETGLIVKADSVKECGFVHEIRKSLYSDDAFEQISYYYFVIFYFLVVFYFSIIMYKSFVVRIYPNNFQEDFFAEKRIIHIINNPNIK